jgi:hypothetical protein
MPRIVEGLTDEDIQILEASKENCNIFLKYYFNVELMPHQLMMAHAQQKSLLTLGGRGSGKTFGFFWSYIWLCTVIPDFRVLWTSYTADQAGIAFYDVGLPIIQQSDRFHKFLPEGLKSLKKKPYPSIHIQIPGTGLPESFMVFKPPGDSGNTKRGFTLDAIHIDEGGLIDDPRVLSTLRPAMRGRRISPGEEPRMCRMSISTTPTPAEWLREWWESSSSPDYIGYSPDDYLSVRVSSSGNVHLTEDQLKSFAQGMSDEERAVELEAEFPEYLGTEFSPASINACEDMMLNREMQEYVALGESDYELKTSGRSGIVLYQKAMYPEGRYVLCGDPGTGSPPYRNAGVILVWDIQKVPYELVYFCWVDGRGDYKPFFSTYEWCYRYYDPIYSAFDATGTQKAMDELYFENNGIIVEGLSVTTEKTAMINTLKIMLHKKLLRFPNISGIRTQLLSYDLAKDKKLAQDIVMAMAMSVWKMRILFYRDASELGHRNDDQSEIKYNRNLRDRRRYTGRK